MKWLKELFKLKPQEIWKNVKCEYLRDEVGQVDEGYWDDPMNYGCSSGGSSWVKDMKPKLYHVYAIYQISVTTNNKRIIEKYESEKIEEFNLNLVNGDVGYEDR